MCFKDNDLSQHLTSCLLKPINSRTCLYITAGGGGSAETTRGSRNGTLIRYQTMTSDLQPFDTYRCIYNTDCCSTRREELGFQLVQSSRTLCPNLVFTVTRACARCWLPCTCRACIELTVCWRTLHSRCKWDSSNNHLV